MISTMPTGILILFSIAALLALLFPLLQDRLFKQIAWTAGWPAIRSFACVLAPALLVLGAGQCLGLEAAQALRYLALGAFLPFLLCRLNLPAKLNGVILLAMAVSVTCFVHETASAPACFALIAGLTVWKVAENLLFNPDSSWQDILPAATWLAGLNWIITTMPAQREQPYEAILLGTLSVALLLRLVQGPFLVSDKVFLKRIILAATGGLSVLIVITKLIMAPDLSMMALMAGAGFFLAYILEGCQDREKQGALGALNALILVGIFTLAASRLFGNFGILILASTMLVGSGAAFAPAAGMFWVARALLSDYVLNYVANVTGVNITHPYAGAALYGGMLLILMASLSGRGLSDRRWLCALYMSGGVLAPLLLNYFLHEEPTASFLAAATMASLLLAALGPVIYRQAPARHENVLLLPVQMLAFALLGNELIPIGNQGITSGKIQALIYCAAVVVLLSFLLNRLFRPSGREPVEIAGN